MSNFVCVRHEKCKVSNKVAKVEEEHKREGEFAKRDNVIPGLTKDNLFFTNMKPEKSMVLAFKERRESYNKHSKRKLRRDAVQCIDSVFCLSKCSKDDMPKIMQAIKDTYKEILDGHAVPMKIWVHCDELGEVHGHGMITPISYNDVCITDLIMKKSSLQKIQDLFCKHCKEQGLEVERGISKQERFEKGMAQNYHVDNWKFLKSDEGQKWLKDKTQIINELEQKELELQQRNKELNDKNRAFGSAYDNNNMSLDDLIDLGRF